MRLTVITFALSLLLSACATSSNTSPSGRKLISEGEYSTIVKNNSDHSRIYSGFYNVLDVQAVQINSQVAQAQMDQATRLYQWSDQKFIDEKAKFENRMATETEFFVTFFTPERKNDDLFKKESIWRIFLDSNGKRYEPKIEKIKLPYAEIIGLYPFHNRFSSAYRIVFPVSVLEIQKYDSTLTFTSPIANGQLDFKKIQ